MLACIACSAKDGGEDGSRAAATPAVRSLTSQLKDMVLKFAGSSKHPSFRRPYPAFIDDTTFTPTGRPASDAGAYTRMAATAASGSASATWDMNGPGIDQENGGEIVAIGVDAAVPIEWTAHVEPGVQITFITLAGGGNDLKRIRFSREMFNKWEAQRWWGENHDRIVELYNVQTSSGRQPGVSTPTSSVDDSLLAGIRIRDSSYSRPWGGSTRESPVAMMPPPSSSSKDPLSRSVSCKAMMPPSSGPYAAGPSTRATYYTSAAAVPDPSKHIWAHHFNMLNAAAAGGPCSYDPSRSTTSSCDEASVSISNTSDTEATEWIEQDEPGVCLTIRELGDGTHQLHRVRFSRERFGEDRAKVWWEQNRDRIQAQYL